VSSRPLFPCRAGTGLDDNARCEPLMKTLKYEEGCRTEYGIASYDLVRIASS
jgi:hypothetical protein